MIFFGNNFSRSKTFSKMSLINFEVQKLTLNGTLNVFFFSEIKNSISKIRKKKPLFLIKTINGDVS